MCDVYASKTCINQIAIQKMFVLVPLTLEITFFGALGQASTKKVGSNFCLNFHWLSNPRQAKYPARWDPLKISQPLTGVPLPRVLSATPESLMTSVC